MHCIAGIVIMAYSPLGNPGRPSFMKNEDDPNPLENSVIKTIAAKHGVPPAHVSRYVLVYAERSPHSQAFPVHFSHTQSRLFLQSESE